MEKYTRSGEIWSAHSREEGKKYLALVETLCKLNHEELGATNEYTTYDHPRKGHNLPY